MDVIVGVFNQVLYYPLFNALIWLYNGIALQDLGVAILILTFLIRLLLFPLSQKAIRSQQAINKLQPKIKEIQKKCKGNKEEQAKQIMGLYKEHRVNPMAGCLPILIQFPILIALYRVFFSGLDPQKLSGLYGFIARPEALNVMFLGIVDLSGKSMVLAFIAGGLQFIQSKMMMSTQTVKKGSDFASIMSKQMTYFMPAITVFIALNLPAALPLYWIAVTSFGIAQHYFTLRSMKKAKTYA